jgi:hypothetical protein
MTKQSKIRRSTPEVVSVEVIGDHALRLKFDDGLVREVDLIERLSGPIFEPLKNPAYFAQVSIDPVGGTICWPNGADFAPDFLHGDYEPDRS